MYYKPIREDFGDGERLRVSLHRKQIVLDIMLKHLLKID